MGRRDVCEDLKTVGYMDKAPLIDKSEGCLLLINFLSGCITSDVRLLAHPLYAQNQTTRADLVKMFIL